MTIAVHSADFDVLAHKGALERVSPDEMSYGVVIALATAIRDGADEAEKTQWLKLALSTPTHFGLVEGDAAAYWKHIPCAWALHRLQT